MKQPATKIIDRHDAVDIFCDGALGISFRHNVCRITLHSDRVDPIDEKIINRVVVGYLSMPPTSFVDLYNKMSVAMEQLTKAGLVQQAPLGKPVVKAPAK